MAILVSIITAVTWATTGIFVKQITHINPFLLAWSRFVIAALCIIIPSRKSLLSDFKSLANRVTSFKYASIMSIYYISATLAFIFAPVSLVALAISLSPIFTILMGWMTKEKILFREICGSFVAFLGVVIFFTDSFQNSLNNTMTLYLGLLLGIASGFLKALYSFVIWKQSRKNSTGNNHQKNSAVFTTLNTFIIGAILLTPSVFLSEWKSSINIKTMILLFCLGLISTALPTFTNTFASQKLTPTIHTVIGLSTPMFASLFAFLFLGEYISIIQVSGMIITLSGVWWVSSVGRSGTSRK